MWGTQGGSHINRVMQRTLPLVSAADAPTVLLGVVSAQAGGSAPGLLLFPAPALPLGGGGPSASVQGRSPRPPHCQNGDFKNCPCHCQTALPSHVLFLTPHACFPGSPPTATCARALQLRASGSKAWAVRIRRVSRILHRCDVWHWATWNLSSGSPAFDSKFLDS